jgi:hypothetical protein
MTKECAKCKELKLESEFYKVSKTNPKLRTVCKTCCAETFKINYKKNPEKYRRYTSSRSYRPALKRKANLKTFGLTVAEYDQMLVAQNNVCAICSNTCSSGKRLAVDHCHITGKIRGLLCRRCNQSIGKFHDDPVLIQKAVDYLLK